MKIQGPHFRNIHAYNKQLQQNRESYQKEQRRDELNISSQAKQLQESNKKFMKRSEYIQQIKNEIKSGKYEINYEETAQKLIDFWSKI